MAPTLAVAPAARAFCAPNAPRTRPSSGSLIPPHGPGSTDGEVPRSFPDTPSVLAVAARTTTSHWHVGAALAPSLTRRGRRTATALATLAAAGFVAASSGSAALPTSRQPSWLSSSGPSRVGRLARRAPASLGLGGRRCHDRLGARGEERPRVRGAVRQRAQARVAVVGERVAWVNRSTWTCSRQRASERASYRRAFGRTGAVVRGVHHRSQKAARRATS